MSDSGGANPHEDIVLRSVAKKARGAVLAAACFLIPALGVAFAALTATDEASRLFAVPMFPVLVLGAAWCWFRSRSFFGGAGSEVARVLLEPRGDVVWVYPHETRVRINFIIPVTVSNDVVIACRDGRRFYLPIPLGTGDRLLSTVRALAPTAAVGYSADRDAKFRRDPGALVLEGAPAGARPAPAPARTAASVDAEPTLFRLLRSEIEKSVEALPGGALRNRMQRIPSPIRGVAGVAALGWAGYSVVTGSGVYGWLVMLPVLATLPAPLLALTTLAICLIVVSVPLALIALILPRKP